jgi:hypothetical protein
LRGRFARAGLRPVCWRLAPPAGAPRCDVGDWGAVAAGLRPRGTPCAQRTFPHRTVFGGEGGGQGALRAPGPGVDGQGRVGLPALCGDRAPRLRMAIPRVERAPAQRPRAAPRAGEAGCPREAPLERKGQGAGGPPGPPRGRSPAATDGNPARRAHLTRSAPGRRSRLPARSAPGRRSRLPPGRSPAPAQRPRVDAR